MKRSSGALDGLGAGSNCSRARCNDGGRDGCLVAADSGLVAVGCGKSAWVTFDPRLTDVHTLAAKDQ